MSPHLCLAVVGPTASGKTKVAIEIAKAIDGEIVCLDSTTVYRGFDVGTSKPTKEEQAQARHHLLDILDPEEAFSAGHFVSAAEKVIESIHSRGKIPIVTGGTYFYLRALQNGMYSTPVISQETIEAIELEFFDEEKNPGLLHEALKAKDPESATRIHPHDRYRLVRALAVIRTTGELPSTLKAVPPSTQRVWLKQAVTISRHTLNENIVFRTDKMLLGGLVDETRVLRDKWKKARALSSIGYREVCRFLDKEINEKEMRNEIIDKTRQFAKRQITWLRNDPELRYIDGRDIVRVQKEVENLRAVLG